MTPDAPSRPLEPARRAPSFLPQLEWLYGCYPKPVNPKFKSACASRVGRSGLTVIQPRAWELSHQSEFISSARGIG
jgi:hypothetical protein